MAMKEMSQPAWWLNYYKNSLKTLVTRTRAHLAGDLPTGILETLLDAIEKDLEEMKTDV